MTEAEAAWIREHAWTTPMRKGYIETPGFYTHCACQWTGPCENDPRPGVHERCHVGRIPMPQYETVITTRNERIAYLREPYRHPTASATGWHHTAVAQVWLARHHCRWTCVCPQGCGHPRADIAHAPVYPVYELVPLFDLVEVRA